MNAVFDRRQRAACDRLVEAIRQEVAETRNYTGRARLSDAVMDAMAGVPRHCFVPGNLQSSAYLNQPLPIGHGQTISQPYIVALMTDMVAPTGDRRVLEVGTGCGYQTAVLAGLSERVYSLEVVEALSTAAATRLGSLGIDNVELRVGDGWQGWPEWAPFDGILVTAAAARVPNALVEQLAPGGRMAIPVGPWGGPQTLYQIEKDADCGLHQRPVLPVAFVPLVGGED